MAARTPSIYSVPQILQFAELAGGYAILDEAQKEIFNGGYIEPLLPEKISFVRKRVQYRYDHNPNDTTLRDTANLLWKLIGRYGLRAANSLEAGGVVVTPATGISTFLVQLKIYPQFIVGAVGAPMVDGQDTLIITDPLAVDQSLQGEVDVHVEGAKEGENIIGRLSFTATYATGQYTIVWNQGLSAGMLVQIEYPIKVILVSQQTSGTGQGLQAIYIVAAATGNTLTVPELGTFMFAQVRGATYDTSVITQIGQNLDFTLVGGTTIGESYLIFYYP